MNAATAGTSLLAVRGKRHVMVLPTEEPIMLAVIAAVLFAIAFIINAAAIATDALLSPLSLLLAGLACLAVHLTGRGPDLPVTRRRR